MPLNWLPGPIKRIAAASDGLSIYIERAVTSTRIIKDRRSTVINVKSCVIGYRTDVV